MCRLLLSPRLSCQKKIEKKTEIKNQPAALRQQLLRAATHALHFYFVLSISDFITIDPKENFEVSRLEIHLELQSRM